MSLGDLYGGKIVLAAEDGLGSLVLIVRKPDAIYRVELGVAENQDEPYVAATVTQTHRIDDPFATRARV